MSNVRTWAQILDQNVDDYSTVTLVCKSMTYQIKKALLTAGWTVSGSSDSATAGMDGSDRTTASWDASKWVCAAEGVAHTWIVLRHAGLGHSVCFNMISANYFAWSWAKTEYTGGSTTNRPTSLDECAYYNGSGIILFDGTATLHRVSLLYSTDGDFIFMLTKSGSGYSGGALALFKLGDLADGDTWPCMGYNNFVASPGGYSAAGMISTSSNFWSKTVKGRSMNGGSLTSNYTAPLVFTINSQPVSSYSGVGSARYAMNTLPALIMHIDVGTPYINSGYKGKLVDVEWCTTSTAYMGQGRLNASPVTRVHIGDLWLPLTVSPTF